MDYNTAAARHALRLQLREQAGRAHENVRRARAKLAEAQAEYDKAVRLHRNALDGLDALDEIEDKLDRR